MEKLTTNNKKLLKELNAQLIILRAQLEQAEQREGKDVYIEVKIKKNQARFEKIKKKGVDDKAVGKFYLEVDITAKQETIFIPISVASGKKVAGFMYQIEGTAIGTIATADIRVRGNGVSQVTLGTLRYAKIPPGKAARFEIRATIRGDFRKTYKIIFTRLNYKLNLADARYRQYLKEIHTEGVTMS